MAYWGKVSEKYKKCVALFETPPNGRKMAGTPPKFFRKYNRSKRLPEKNWPIFYPYPAVISAILSKISAILGSPKNEKFEILANFGQKTTFVEKKFSPIFSVFLGEYSPKF